jgi:excisionase family DNA binding protein
MGIGFRSIPSGSKISVAFVSIKALIAPEHAMITTRQARFSSRFDPAAFSSEELESVSGLIELFRRETRPPALVDETGARTELPRPIFEMLVRVASALQEGKVITLVPETQELTTQAAANVLGVSRPHLVKLLETGALPYHKVGAHRRVLMKDLVEYQRVRDAGRREALDELARRAQEAGLY